MDSPVVKTSRAASLGDVRSMIILEYVRLACGTLDFVCLIILLAKNQ